VGGIQNCKRGTEMNGRERGGVLGGIENVSSSLSSELIDPLE